MIIIQILWFLAWNWSSKCRNFCLLYKFRKPYWEVENGTQEKSTWKEDHSTDALQSADNWWNWLLTIWWRQISLSISADLHMLLIELQQHLPKSSYRKYGGDIQVLYNGTSELDKTLYHCIQRLISWRIIIC